MKKIFQLQQSFSQISSREEGVFSIVLALTFFGLLALLGLAVDTFYLGVKKTTLQNSGDLAVLSGAQALVGGYSPQEAQAVVEKSILINLLANKVSSDERAKMLAEDDYSVFANFTDGAGAKIKLTSPLLLLNMVPNMRERAVLGHYASQPLKVDYRKLAVAIIIDDSAWAAGHVDGGISKFQHQKHAANELIDRLDENDSLLLVTSGYNSRNHGCFQMNEAGKSAAKSAVDALAPNSYSADFTLGLSAANQLRNCANEPVSEDAYHIAILLTASPWLEAHHAGMHYSTWLYDWCDAVDYEENQEEALLKSDMITAIAQAGMLRRDRGVRFFAVGYGSNSPSCGSCTEGVCHPTITDENSEESCSSDPYDRWWHYNSDHYKPVVLRQIANVRRNSENEPYNDPQMPCVAPLAGDQSRYPEGAVYEADDGRMLPAIMADIVRTTKVRYNK